MSTDNREFLERPSPWPFIIAFGLIVLSLSFVSAGWDLLVMIPASLFALWWANKHHRPFLIDLHRQKLGNETIEFDGHTYDLEDVQFGPAQFFLLQYGMPQVRQHAQLVNRNTGRYERFVIITRFSGAMTLHPIKD